MRWPRRGILIRLAIYVPVISLLAWRAQGGCDQPDRAEKEDPLEQKLAPHRKLITLPDGTQQEVVELTAEEAEAILGHPIPRKLDAPNEEHTEAKAGGSTKSADATTADAKAGTTARAADAQAAEAEPRR